MSRLAFRRCAAAAFVLVFGCVPTEFTFVGEGGAGGAGAASAGGMGAGGAGGGVSLTCGDGIQDDNELCDDGEQNRDDFDDLSYATQRGTERGCSTSCEPIVAWTWNYSVES